MGDDTIPSEFVKFLQIDEMRVARANLDLHAVRLEVAVVEPGTLREQSDDALSSLLTLDERRDVVEHDVSLPVAIMRSADKAGAVVQANTAGAKELTFAIRLHVGLPVVRNATPRVILKFRVEVTETDR
jgi:hypothetical protein